MVTDPGTGYARYLARVFDERAAQPWLVSAFDERAVTYGEAFETSRRIAGWMTEHGVGRGGTVAFSSSNDIDLALCYLGAMHLGARIVPLNPQLSDADRRAILAANRPDLVLTSPKLKQETAALSATASPASAVMSGTETLLAEDARSANPCARTFDASDDIDVFLTAYSSGSTAAPKGVDVTWQGMFGNGIAYARHMGLDRDCRFYNTLPMTYMGGFYNMTMLPAVIGATTIIDHVLGPANIFGYWDQVGDLNADTLWFAAAILSMLMTADRGDDLSGVTSRVRFAFCGFAPLPQDVRERFEARFGLTLLENYASSECLFVTAQKPGAVYPEGSKGPPLEGITVEITDESGACLPAGSEGEVRIVTPHLTAGYRAGNESDAAAITPHGFLSGDLGHLDERNELFITGRAKELIIRGGENISPAGVEEELLSHPAVAEAAVCGIPDEVYGEAVGAVLVLAREETETGVADIARFYRGALPDSHVPARIMTAQALPKGATGKLDRKAVREILLKGANG